MRIIKNTISICFLCLSRHRKGSTKFLINIRKLVLNVNQIKISEYLNSGNSPEIIISGKQKDNSELVMQAIQTLMSQIDVKHFCNEDFNRFNEYIDRLLISVTDIVGYEHHYWEQVPDSGKTYSDFDELELVREEKIKLLKEIVNNL